MRTWQDVLGISQLQEEHLCFRAFPDGHEGEGGNGGHKLCLLSFPSQLAPAVLPIPLLLAGRYGPECHEYGLVI